MANSTPDILTKTHCYTFKVGQDRPIFDFQKRIYEHVMQDLYKKEQPMQYIIWGPSGLSNPKVRFYSEVDAQGAADKMAEYHKQEFIVCKLISSTKPAPKTITTKLA